MMNRRIPRVAYITLGPDLWIEDCLSCSREGSGSADAYATLCDGMYESISPWKLSDIFESQCFRSGLGLWDPLEFLLPPSMQNTFKLARRIFVELVWHHFISSHRIQQVQQQVVQYRNLNMSIFHFRLWTWAIAVITWAVGEPNLSQAEKVSPRKESPWQKRATRLGASATTASV